MTTINLDVKPIAPPRSRQVHASARDVGDGGNATLPPGAEIVWTANGNDVFRVIFQDLDKSPPDNWIFPFAGPNDGPFGTHNAPSLEVKHTPGGKKTVLSAGAPENIKYSVYSTSETNAIPLDPMIVIRPASVAPASALLGATCAVLGAAVGAAITWAMM
jgi:hypothetical protein